MANKVFWGIENVHYALLDEETGDYGTPKHIPGAVNLGLSLEGEESVFYADDIKYFFSTSNNGYSADLEMATFPTSFLVDVLGYVKDTNGVEFEYADAIQVPFALLFQVKGDVGGAKYVYYNVKASRPSKTHATQEASGEPETETSTLTIAPIAQEDGKLLVKTKIEPSTANAAVYNSWFASVYIGASE